MDTGARDTSSCVEGPMRRGESSPSEGEVSTRARAAWLRRRSSRPGCTTWSGRVARTVPSAVWHQFLGLGRSATTGRRAFSAVSPEATRDTFGEPLRCLQERPVGSSTYTGAVADVVNSLYSVHPGWTEFAGRLQDLWRGCAPRPSPLPPPAGGPQPESVRG